MHRLTLLGGLRIEGDDGPLPGRASQRRRLALLALLASPPGHRTTRDKLTAMLWPETSDERARRNLSSALYDLRAELGEDVVVASGDDLALNPAVVATDVADFAGALEAGDLDGATAAYGGPFLDGFFIGDAEEFERWVEGERQRYARDYTNALLQMAERHSAAGDARAAADAWHRLSVADPFNARIAVGYMTALDASGDRAAALRFARVHTALLREELGAEPSPEVNALAERLRASPTAADMEAMREPRAPAPSSTAPGGATAPTATDAPDAPGSVSVGPTVQTPAAAAGAGGPALGPGRPAGGRRAARRRRMRWAVLATGVLVVGLVGALAIGLLGYRDRADAAPAESGTGVAVMPFQNLGGTAEMDPFCAGLTEEIITGLARVEELRIPSRTTMVLYQGRAVPASTVGRELGVRYLVEGTVRSEDTRLRIAASLVDTRTGSRIWDDQYDLHMVSVFDAQEQIAQAVVRAVAPQLAGTLGPLVQPTTRDDRAYRLYLKGRDHWYRRSPEDLGAALTYFQRALEQDPGYALAYSAVADVYNLLGAYDYGVAPPATMYPSAREAAERALRLSPDLAEAHAALANVLFNYDWDLPGAELRYRRALRLNPGYGMARHWLSLLLVADGRHDEALREIHTAREFDPRSPVLSSSLARHYYFQGDYERAIDEFQNAIALDPTHVNAYLGAGLALVQLEAYDRALAEYEKAAALIGVPHAPTLALIGHAEGLAGRTERAIAIQRRLMELRASGAYVAPQYLALVSLGLGDVPRALDLLEESLEERSAALLYARIDPIVTSLQAEPRFAEMLRRVRPGAPAERRPAGRVRDRVRSRTLAARPPRARAAGPPAS
jgi:DNA-binding SARP family transcriptional activator/TolB-like protein